MTVWRLAGGGAPDRGLVQVLGIVVLSGLMLGSCVTESARNGTDGGRRQVTMERVLQAGYSTIANRYVDPVDYREVAFATIKGVAALDPAITIQETDGRVAVKLADKELVAYMEPPPDDARAWGRLAADGVAQAYRGSGLLQAYQQDRVLKAAMEGALQPLDKHSRYADPASANDNRFVREGAGGIGISVKTVEGEIVVGTVFPDMPAARAGVLPEDRIVAVDGVSTVGWDERRAVEHLRGEIDTRVEVTLVRPGGGDRRTVSIVRSLIIPPTVTYTRQDDIAVIKLSGFNQATTVRLQNAIERAQQEIGPALAGVILDLRGNPGGLLDQAISVVDLFVPDGVVASTRGRHPDSGHVYRSAGSAIAPRIPMVILINGRSASAAEIVAAALQDRGRAVVIGTNSYGKGTVQTVVRLPNEGELTLTWSRLHAPSGYSWHEIGVMPTVCTSDVANDGDGFANQFAERARRMAEVITLWHASSRPPPDRLAQLRETCSPSDQQPEKDSQIAARLLHDKPLYNRAIGVTQNALAVAAAR